MRDAAAEQLKQRPIFSYLPVLMGSLKAPVEFSYCVTTLSHGYLPLMSLSRETPLADYSLTSRFSPSFHPIWYWTQPQFRRHWETAVPRLCLRMNRIVVQTNANAAAMNSRIIPVLRRTVGQDLGDGAQAWWQWWADYNELPGSDQKRVVQYNDDRGQLWSHLGLSCFAAGTLVWTETGPVAIERIRSGDRVLSQDPESGELAYKLVLDTTIRPPSTILRIRVAGSDIDTTRGHPFWRSWGWLADGEGTASW